MPAKGKPRTVVIMAHPRGDFAQHYSIPFWVEAGFAAFAQNTRYLNNDSMMMHENLLHRPGGGNAFPARGAGLRAHRDAGKFGRRFALFLL